MKSRELIKLLTTLDPEGNTDVVINNCTIYDLELLPGFYDGSNEVIEYAEEEPPYRVPIKAYIGGEWKIVIKYRELYDVILDYPELPVNASPSALKVIEEWREDGREFNRNMLKRRANNDIT